MNVLVTGAVGRIGRHIVRALVEAGHHVRATDHRFDRELPVKVEVANLLDRAAVYRLVDGVEAVIHLGNHPSLLRGLPYEQVYGENVMMTGNVAIVAVELGVKTILYASSIQAIGGTRQVQDADKPSELPYLPLDGDLPANPGNAYALSKVAGEQLLQLLVRQNPELSATAIRFPAMWDSQWRGWFRRNRSGRRVPEGFADEAFSYLSMEDAATLAVAALAHRQPGYRQWLPAAPDNIACLPIEEIVARWFANVPLRKPLGELSSLIDISAITDQTGWVPRHLLRDEPAEAAAATGGH